MEPKTEGVPGPSSDALMTAGQWWREDRRVGLDPAAAAELRDEIFSTRVAPRCQSTRSLHSLKSPMRGHGLQCTRSKRRE